MVERLPAETITLIADIAISRNMVENILRSWVTDSERRHNYPTQVANPLPDATQPFEQIKVAIDAHGNATLSYRTDGTMTPRATPEQIPTLVDIKNMEAVLRECRAYLQGSYREMPTGKTTMVLIDKIDMIVPRGE